MRKVFEIKKDLSAKANELKSFDIKANSEDDVTRKIDEVNDLIRELESANTAALADEALATREFAKEIKKGNSFSLLRLCDTLAKGKNLTGIEAEVAEEGTRELNRLGLTQLGVAIPSFAMRSADGNNTTNASDGGNMTETMADKYIDVLRNKLVVAGLGANVLGGLVGTLPLISSTDVTASWGAEADETAISKATFAKATMTPHRNSVRMNYTKDLTRQTSVDVESMFLEKILHAQAELIDVACIKGSGSASQPTGILNTSGITTVAGGTNGLAINWKNVVALETAINALNANKGNLGYLTNAKVWGCMKQTEKITGKSFILEEPFNMLNGYKVDWSNIVPSDLTKGTGTALSALIFGNWADLFIGHWAGVDLVIDPYTDSKKGEVNLVLNSWDDVKVAEPKSFAIIKDIIA